MMKVPFFRTPYNYDRDIASVESGLLCEDESLAIQSAAEEADINTIVRRFGLTGQLPGQVAVPRFGDFTNVPDFQTAMNLIRETQNEFMRLPAEIRARFDNDPQRVIDFLEDDRNRDEAIKLGLVNSVPVEAPSGTPDGAAAS
jgi:phage internal scaffolding protein